MKTSDLTHAQLLKIVKIYPSWMANNRPEWMANNRPEWMANNRPEWMAKYYPELLKKYDNVPEDILKLIEE